MSISFFERPVLNSPYEYPSHHWELDDQGQPTQRTINARRPAEFVTPIPKPRKRRGGGRQQDLVFDEGRRLYLRYGFFDVEPIDRWAGKLANLGEGGETVPLDEALLEEAAGLDRIWSGSGRSSLIRRLGGEKDVAGLGLRRHGVLDGFGFVRPGRSFWHLGPVLARAEDDFAALLDGAAAALHGAPVLLDAPRREETSALLQQRGLTVQRRLTRMTLGSARPVLNGPHIRAATSFEWG